MTLAESCYSSMFYGTSIVVAPELPATTKATNSYQSMFLESLSLTVTPALPALACTLGCYLLMIQG